MAYRRRIEAATTLVLSLGSRGVDRMVWRGRQRGRGSGRGVDSDGEVFLVGGRATRSKTTKSQPCRPVSLDRLVRGWRLLGVLHTKVAGKRPPSRARTAAHADLPQTSSEGI